MLIISTVVEKVSNAALVLDGKRADVIRLCLELFLVSVPSHAAFSKTGVTTQRFFAHESARIFTKK
ncbi:MAG: hypothetical protein WEB62_07195, partial [Bacteroidota bacterium]